MTQRFRAPEIERMAERDAERRAETLKMHCAQQTARNFVKKNNIVKEACVCGRDDVHMHHVDYDQPLLVAFLCQRCHPYEHKVGLPVSFGLRDLRDLVRKPRKQDLGIYDALETFGPKKIRQVRSEYAGEPTRATIKRLSDEFNVSLQTIRNVLKGLKTGRRRTA